MHIVEPKYSQTAYFLSYSGYEWFSFAQNTRWHLVFPRFGVIFYPSHSVSWLNFGLEFSSLPISEFMASSLDCALPACLAWAWTSPAGMSTCSWRSLPLWTGGQNVISLLSISPYPMEQDALFAPNRPGNLPTKPLSHMYAWKMLFELLVVFF